MQYFYLAQTYGCDAYGQNAYNTCSTTPSGGGSTGGTTDGGSRLADTGITVAIFIGVALVVMLAAMTVRFWRRKKTTAPAKPTTTPKKPTKTA